MDKKLWIKNADVWRYFISVGAFLLLYIVGTVLPLKLTPHYHNYTSRVWNWTEILITLAAIFFIAKAGVFRWRQAVAAVVLGAVCLTSLLRDPRTADIIMTGVCVMAAFYAGCRLFELADAENATLGAGIVGSVGSFCLGAVVSIPLAALNVLYFSLSRPISVGNVFTSAVFALKPAIAEETVFRFFMLAYVCYLFRGKTKGRFKTVLIYIMLTIPHDLLHYPDMFRQSPLGAIGMCALNAALFGLPMALLMKRRNLQMAVGMHWFIDFVRFAAGF